MANFSLVVNSKFNPFSFERYIQPYQIYGQAYREVEDALSELDTKASVWEEMANEQTDPYAYKMYKTYANDLEEKAGQLAREGLNAASRRDMLNMRARYSKEIIPIENAYKKREEDIARQKKVSDATGGRTVFTRDARTTSLDKYMEGIDDYGQTNLDELYKEGAAGGAAISKRYLSTREGQLFNGMYLNLQRTTGMTNGQIQQFLSNQKDAKGNLLFPELHALKNELLSKSNYQNYSVADQNRMEQAILSGINTGIVYNVEDKPMENWRAKMAAQEAMQKRLNDYQRQQAALDKMKIYNINPSTLYSKGEVVAQNKKIKDLLEKFKSKGYFNSRGALTNAGMKALQNATERNQWRKGPGSEYYEVPVRTGDWEFKNWALKHGLTQSNIDAGNIGDASINNYYRSTLSKINSGELATGTPNIDIYRQAVRDKTTRDFLAEKVTNTIGANGKIYRVGDLTVTDGKVTMGRGKGVSQKDFKKLVKDSPILYIANSPVTNSQIIELTDGSRFIMPADMLDNINRDNLAGANVKIMQSASSKEAAVNLNNANSYLGAILNYNEGTGISTNDGTIIVQ